jgi:hypothetical protein
MSVVFFLFEQKWYVALLGIKMAGDASYTAVEFLIRVISMGLLLFLSLSLILLLRRSLMLMLLYRSQSQEQSQEQSLTCTPKSSC